MLALVPYATAQAPLWEATGAQDGAGFGAAVDAGLDFDGDGVPDAFVGAPQGHPLHPGPGTASLISGVDGRLIWRWSGLALGDQFGSSVAMLGDVDGDARPDLAVGAPRGDNGGGNAGYVAVYSGATKQRIFLLVGGSAGALFGTSIAALRDLDGDGRVDFAVGAPQNAVGPGFVRVISGASGSTIRTHTGASTNEHYGVSVANVGDVDLDGKSDLGIGAERADVPALDAGAVQLRSGANGTLLRTWTGPTALDEFGHAVLGAGDLDGDGKPEVLIAAWNDDAGSGFEPGAVSLWSSGSGAQLDRWIGITADDHLGKGLGAVGDVDGDGTPDFAYSGRHDLNDQHPGDVYVRSGATRELLFFFWGDRIEDEFGLGVAGLGDVDGDGLGDFIVGAPENYHFQPKEGYVRALGGCLGRLVAVLHGCPHGPNYPRLFVEGCPGPGAVLHLTINEAAPFSTAHVRIARPGNAFDSHAGCFGSAVNSPFAAVFAIQLDAQGRGSRDWQIPANAPSGTRLWIEALVRSPGVTKRTNVFELRTP